MNKYDNAIIKITSFVIKMKFHGVKNYGFEFIKFILLPAIQLLETNTYNIQMKLENKIIFCYHHFKINIHNDIHQKIAYR
jgi:hypothetical protein